MTHALFRTRRGTNHRWRRLIGQGDAGLKKRIIRNTLKRRPVRLHRRNSDEDEREDSAILLDGAAPDRPDA
jgi:hypothetical protein